MTPFAMTEPRLKAVMLVALDELSDEAIADEVGIGRKTLYRWRQHPVFQEHVSKKISEIEAAVSRYPIAKRRERIKAMNRRWQGFEQIMNERGEALAREAPGGGSGLLTKTIKLIGTGENATMVEEYTTDSGLSAEMRALEKQAAQELGQWSEKAEVNHTGGIRREFVIVTDTGARPLTEAELAAIDDQDPA